MRSPLAVLALPLVLLAPAVPLAHAGPVASDAAATAAPQARESAARIPALRVRRVVSGLSIPWDVKVLPDSTLLMTERGGRLSTYADGTRRTVDFPSDRIWVSGETGLMSLEVDPDFAENRRFYTCSGWQEGGSHDVRVNAWRLSDDSTAAELSETLVSRFPTSSGRHGGCRLLITEGGSLVVGTGDAAQGRNPRNLRSLGGKTLRLDRLTGRPHRDNPFARAENRRKRYVYTYGHRNVQGLAQRADGSLWSVEHGSFRDDEVNLLRPGGDYGWHPVPGYNESVPMTDHSLPGRQRSARWSSGNPTLATSGAAWVRGSGWGKLRGTLAVAALASQRMIFMKFDGDGDLRWTRAPRSLRGMRLRSVTRTPGNALLVTTSDGNGNDEVLRITPRRR